ncbi:MAG: hypothetical protein MR707_03270, partial [Galactobacillus timonensis]|uniref:hypothetical protein n=1 Tax=Galactobacillus timonensis TaxID=2041840 RepID=UPI0023F2444B
MLKSRGYGQEAGKVIARHRSAGYRIRSSQPGLPPYLFPARRDLISRWPGPEDDCSIGQPFSGYALRSSPMTDIVIPGILIRKGVFFNEYLSPLSGA